MKNLRRFDEQHRQFRHIPKVIKESYLNQKHPTNSKVECVFFCSGYSQASTIYFKSTIQKQLQPRKIRPKSFINTKEKRIDKSKNGEEESQHSIKFKHSHKKVYQGGNTE